MIPCEFNSMLGRYHDGELTDAQRRQVDNHLRDCPPCAYARTSSGRGCTAFAPTHVLTLP